LGQITGRSREKIGRIPKPPWRKPHSRGAVVKKGERVCHMVWTSEVRTLGRETGACGLAAGTR